MPQLRLFPPPGAVVKPLPPEVLREARELVVELLSVVLEEGITEQSPDEGETDE